MVMASKHTKPREEEEEEEPLAGEGRDEKCPVEEVGLVVPETDDPSMPVLTFRAWFLGMFSCLLLIFLNTFFTYRTQPLFISAILMQIVTLPLGRTMAAILPKGKLNPGPFNIKEHVVITVLANCGSAAGGSEAYAMGVITVMKTYYKLNLTFFAAFLIVLTSQLIGYGWAGMLRKYLVEPAEMWWPSNLAQVSLFRALHEKEERKKKGVTRMQFFLMFMAVSFAYYTFPGYLFPLLTFFSWTCWLFPRSVTAQQIGSGYHGLGLGAFSLDWAGIAAYHGSPLVTPWVSILNIAFGFILFIYVIFPVCYWKFNTFEARRFPIFSNQLFDSQGQNYDVTKILNSQFELDTAAFQKRGPLYMCSMYAMSLGSGFARTSSVFMHVAIFHGRDIWKTFVGCSKNMKLDIHARLMKNNYKGVPEWWFLIILTSSVGLSLLVSVTLKQDLQLPWWGFLFAAGLAWLLTLPVGVIQATTNQQPGYDIVAQLMIGYLLPGKPIANLLFKVYGKASILHALTFLSDLKLGHYMKIPPRSMFTVQLVGSLVASLANLGIGWWMLGSIPNICDVEVLHPDSPWTCPRFRVMFDTTVVWGLLGPERLFGPKGLYKNMIWLFPLGALLPLLVWVATKTFPKQKWIPLINIPLITCGFVGIPPAAPTNIASWILVGMVFNHLLFKYQKGWWQKYNYVLSSALDAGTAFMGVLIFFALQNSGKNLKWWGTQPDHCPLATCPTSPGIVVSGCPSLN
ncbi:OLC1v1021112C1 [Oldenlandia corymbosa var. corymbosa]|uniref:OLC1v1021112C1 n=1 Tax=Oldenlandia corymbosa var. corymbosa TaxID=529605 RepID=A0AAV1BX60_OLDCO|nr:OLC1v1021112C1 [Oldenlandia corymbosa var. corymbosa]